MTIMIITNIKNFTIDINIINDTNNLTSTVSPQQKQHQPQYQQQRQLHLTINSSISNSNTITISCSNQNSNINTNNYNNINNNADRDINNVKYMYKRTPPAASTTQPPTIPSATSTHL